MRPGQLPHRDASLRRIEWMGSSFASFASFVTDGSSFHSRGRQPGDPDSMRPAVPFIPVGGSPLCRFSPRNCSLVFLPANQRPNTSAPNVSNFAFA